MIRKTIHLQRGRTFSLVVGDLLDEPVEAIVNAANGRLAHGGGVAAAIASAAGDEFDAASETWVATHGTIPTGEAVVTTAGRLQYRGVIHAVGPVRGEGDEEEKLTRAVANALLRAHEQGWSSVSFPAISSGIFAVPLDVCARAYVAGVRRHLERCPESAVREIRLCVFESPIVDHIEEAMARHGQGEYPGA